MDFKIFFIFSGKLIPVVIIEYTYNGLQSYDIYLDTFTKYTYNNIDYILAYKKN